MRWQLKLLWQSMRNLGIENNLLVGVCDNPYEPQPSINYCRSFKHENAGLNFGYSPVNKPYALMEAAHKRLLKQPFTVIDPDMVFLKPVYAVDTPVAAQYVWHMELSYLENDVKWLFLKDLGLEEYRDKWRPIGCVYQFNDINPELFDDIYYTCTDFAAMYKPGDGKLAVEQAYWVREMLAFALPISACYDVKVVNDFQMPLDPRVPAGRTDSKNSCLVHYCASYKPYFDKHKFHQSHPEYIDERSLLDTINRIPSHNARVKAVKGAICEDRS